MSIHSSDSLIAKEDRMRKGAFYTPLNLVTLSYSYLDKALGTSWQQDYVVWDMCCGTGNLEYDHKVHTNLFMSTLDQSDIDMMIADGYCTSATMFQYDYLNDDIAADGSIDYSLSNKIPQELRDIIKDCKSGNKKLLILINPPYAEAGSGISVGEKKEGVSNTQWSSCGMKGMGKAKNELFAQFLSRILIEIPMAVVAVFSTPKYINAESFKNFHEVWTGDYAGGFVVPSRIFKGINGSFPISFVIWSLGVGTSLQSSKPLVLDVFDKKCNMIGAKAFYPLNGALTLNKWVVRDKFEDIDCIPLKNAISPATTNIRVSKWHKDAIAYMLCDSNAVSHGQQRTAIFSSAFGGGHGFYITAANIVKASIIFSVRMSTTHTWLNHQDQFYTPSSAPSLDFENDCLIYMLFSGKNLSASAELDWNGKKWQVVNHFIPFTEIDVGSKNSFRSNFMSSFLAGRGVISQEASDVMNEGKKIYALYFTKTFDADITKKLHLNEPDVGWYQIRKALVDDDFTAFNNAYKKLEDKIYQAAVLFGFIR